jgi:hypothetical protein
MVTRQPGHRPRIEVLYVPECPHYPGALALVERIRGELGIDTELRTSLISDQAAAERARFPGSPTIRVDGRDVEPGSPSTRLALLACRLYRHEQGLAGKPAEAWVRDALLAAARTDASPSDSTAPTPRSARSSRSSPPRRWRRDGWLTTPGVGTSRWGSSTPKPAALSAGWRPHRRQPQ